MNSLISVYTYLALGLLRVLVSLENGRTASDRHNGVYGDSSASVYGFTKKF